MNNLYILAGESYMVRESLKELKHKLGIEYPEFNVTELKTMPKAQDLIVACRTLPFMSKMRLVVVAECTAITSKGSKAEQKEKTDSQTDSTQTAQIDGKGKKDEGKAIADFLADMPETTVLVLCTEDTLDKRRALYTKIKSLGTVKEFAQPGADECVRFVQRKANELGAQISAGAASNLVAAAGCDYHILEGETAKLAAYSGYGVIKEEHIAICAAKSLEYNVFEIHGLLIKKQAAKARELLDDILRSERPEGLIGLIARKIRDMYKVKAMSDAGYTAARAAEVMGYKSFAVQMILKDSKRFSGSELRSALCALAELDYGIKSGERDASFALPETLLKIYKV